MSRDQISTFLDRHLAAQNQHDAARLATDYAEECIVDSPSGGTHRGRAAVERVFSMLFEAFPDMVVRPEKLVIEGNHVSRVVTIEGTDMGGFMGVPPTGKPFRIPAVFVYEFKDGLILKERSYDFTGLLLQVGVLKAKLA
jgi:steroid delta-isomerase-like uncharacterized protein